MSPWQPWTPCSTRGEQSDPGLILPEAYEAAFLRRRKWLAYMTIRLVFDLGCYGVGLILGIRLLGKLTPGAARFGFVMTILSVAGNLAIWRLWAPEGVQGDIAYASIILGFTVVSRGRWERFVGSDQLKDGAATGTRSQRRLVNIAALAAVIAYFPAEYLVSR